MRMEDYLKVEATAVRRCPARQLCPIGALCEEMTSEDEENPLFPAIVDCPRGQIAWTDPHSEQRVFFIKSGIFSCVSGLDNDQEVPFALYGCGHAAGLGELYIPRTVGRTYYLRAISHGTLCSLPAKPLRRRLESTPQAYALAVMSSALTNLSSAAYAQEKLVSRPLLSERIALLIIRLRHLAAREGRDLDEIRLTHEELAALVASDRTSVSRALQRMAQDGLVELGYRRIKPTAGFDSLEGLDALRGDACAQFHPAPTKL